MLKKKKSKDGVPGDRLTVCLYKALTTLLSCAWHHSNPQNSGMSQGSLEKLHIYTYI